MKYFNRLLTLVFITCLISCSEDNNLIVNSLSSTNTFIGDTLTLTGTNLNQIGIIALYNEDIDEILGNEAKIISKTETEIKFIVPDLFHEKATIYFDSNLDPIDIELYGYIPYGAEFGSTIFREAKVKQILNDNVAFCIGSSGRFKLTNNFSKIENLPSGNSDIVRYFYINENTGYIITAGGSNFQIYSFNDNVNNRKFEYSISKFDLNNGGRHLRDVKFVSNNLAYIMNEDGEMFQILDGIATPFNDLYPELISTPYMSQEYMNFTTNFKVLEDNSIIISPWYQNYIFKIKNGEANVITFNGNTSSYDRYTNNISEPDFINNLGGFYSKTEHKIYKSDDYGQTWSSNDINFPKDENIFIEYLGGNQFILHRYLIDPSNINLKSKYISTDNGNSWRRIYYSSRNGYGGEINMHNEFGLTNSDTYGLVKFRRFPNDF